MERGSKTRRRVLGMATVAGLVVAVAPVATRGPANGTPNIRTQSPPPANSTSEATALRVVSLNLAHGRADGRHQALLPRTRIRVNLDRVAVYLREIAPDVVALQEADGPSLWSGRFDHVDYLAEQGRFWMSLRGEHVDGPMLHYGTAILSQSRLSEARSRTFEPSWPTFSKGLVEARVAWPGRPDVALRVVSVHLDYASARVRERQVRELVAVLAESQEPLIVMGDFNCDLTGQDESLRTLVNELGLVAHAPAESDLATFPSGGHRLDWILLSSDLRFRSYENGRAGLSDHLAVVAEIELIGLQRAGGVSPGDR